MDDELRAQTLADARRDADDRHARGECLGIPPEHYGKGFESLSDPADQRERREWRARHATCRLA